MTGSIWSVPMLSFLSSAETYTDPALSQLQRRHLRYLHLLGISFDKRIYDINQILLEHIGSLQLVGCDAVLRRVERNAYSGTPVYASPLRDEEMANLECEDWAWLLQEKPLDSLWNIA